MTFFKLYVYQGNGRSPNFAPFLWEKLPRFWLRPCRVSLTVWVYLHSNLCSGLQKTHLFCNRMRFGRSSSMILVPIESAYRKTSNKCPRRLLEHRPRNRGI